MAKALASPNAWTGWLVQGADGSTAAGQGGEGAMQQRLLEASAAGAQHKHSAVRRSSPDRQGRSWQQQQHEARRSASWRAGWLTVGARNALLALLALYHVIAPLHFLLFPST